MSAPAPLSSLIRAALMVADLERSSAFYRALGLSETYYEGDLDSDSVAKTLHLPAGSRCRCRILKRASQPNYGMVGLFEISNPKPEALAPPQSVTPRIGEVAIVFYVADLPATFDAIAHLGASVTPHWVNFVMPHRSQREGCLRDPDGVLINLVERPVDEQFATAPALVVASTLDER
jgi:catechol 2,3-dioxygenase-like lactoylglutathione lyase family enzyme